MFISSHTCFSLGHGTLRPAELAALAKSCGVEMLALTDIHNTSGLMDFVRACRSEGIKPVAGIEFRRGGKLSYLGIAHNLEGYRELNEFLSAQLHAGVEPPERPPQFEHVSVIFPFGYLEAEDLGEQEFTGIRASELNLLYSSPYRKHMHKCVALHPVTFRDKIGWNLHRLLLCIQKNILLSKLSPDDTASIDEVMVSSDRLRELFSAYPELVTNAEKLIASCSFEFDFTKNRNRATFTKNQKDDRELLRKLAFDGLRYRYGAANAEAKIRIQRELDIIDRLGFSAYFLITWDFVRYAQSRGFFHVGRGSGANSIVAYCMGITDVDPIELDLYFERFLNPHRSSPPDFDIDFSWKDRDEVIDYIFKRYGGKHTTMIATYATYQKRAVIRELGKVFGLPKSEIDRLADGAFRKEEDHIVKLIVRYGERMIDMPQHLSVHPGGILIAEEPIHTVTATDLPPKGFPITHFDMVVAEEVGLYKFDVLSQRGLGHIRDAAEAVLKNRGVRVDVHDVKAFKKDPRVRELLETGRTIGCFYVESPAMRQLLQKLECKTYLELVAASSIIRPGVAQSGMMREYISRHKNPKGFEYLHPKMEELLQETYGVMVYQEDVIKVAHHFGGLDLGESDVLRRVMSGKTRDAHMKIAMLREKFFGNCAQKGYPESITAEVWRQIESFSGYSFSKAHSASFAVESYQSLYLKAHFPIEFMVGVINNFGGFYATEFYFHEARISGATVHPPCVNRSAQLTSVSGKDIWMGFVHVKDLQDGFIQTLVADREADGAFSGLEDFNRRLRPGIAQLMVLIRMGALRFIGRSKKQLLWEAHMLLGAASTPQKQSTVLFSPPEVNYTLPELPDDPLEDAWDQIRLLGFPLCDPFTLTDAPRLPDLLAKDLPALMGKKIQIAGYLVTVKHLRTSTGKPMCFGTLLDRQGRWLDTTHFPESLMSHPFTGGGVYIIYGKVIDDFGVVSIEVDKMMRQGLLGDPRAE